MPLWGEGLDAMRLEGGPPEDEFAAVFDLGGGVEAPHVELGALLI